MFTQTSQSKMAQENQGNVESDLTELSWLTNKPMFGAKSLLSPLTSPDIYPKNNPLYQHDQPQTVQVLSPLANFNRQNVAREKALARSAFCSYTTGIFNRKKLLEARKKKTEQTQAEDEQPYSPLPSTNSTLSISPSLPSSPSASSSSSSSYISPASSPPRCAFSPIKSQFPDVPKQPTMHPTLQAPMCVLGGKGNVIARAGRKLAKPQNIKTRSPKNKFEQPTLNDAYKSLLLASVSPSIYAVQQLIQQKEQFKSCADEEETGVQQLNRPLPTNYKFKNTCGMNKPPLTLSSLIFMAIQESRDKCLPVRRIYEWIEDNFPFYQNVSNGGWKSSIRHNLSFSKCFKKMDRGESALVRSQPDFSNDVDQGSLTHEGSVRKRRAPNSAGTCWKVNPECRSFLIQTLKKSSFWFHNSKYYPNLSRYITNYCSSMSEQTAEEQHKAALFAAKKGQYVGVSMSSKKLKVADEKTDKISIESDEQAKIKQEEESSDYDYDDEDDESMMISNQNRLLKFVQAQQRELCSKNLMSPCQDTPTTSKMYEFNAASILPRTSFKGQEAPLHNQSALELSLSSSSSSLTSAFALLSSSSTSSVSPPLSSSTVSTASNEEVAVNSDLEMEVASTLVGMKWSASRQHQTKSS